MEYYVADTYKNMERVGEPFKKNGRMYTVVEGACDRCGGSGMYKWGAVINGSSQYAGGCFKCGGTGKLHKEVRLYTKKEYEAAVATRERARERRAAKVTERAERLRKNALVKWLERNGFDEEGNTYIFYGNTYPIKDQLKEAGCKFSKELMWHGPAAVDVPEDCFVEKIHYSDVYNWHEEDCDMWKTEEGAKFLADVFSKHALGIYLGEIGERLRDLSVVFEKAISFDGNYGPSHSYRFSCDGAQLTWFTTKELDLEEGERYTLTGTVKKHQVYGNVKTTYLNRCIVK